MNGPRRPAPGEGARATATGTAFTLLELLVVIAILGIVAGLLLPTLARARESARAIQCLGQMRQIALAIRLYAEDHNDFFPRSQHSAFAYDQSAWGRAIAPDLGQASNAWTNLFDSLYHCPSDRRKAPWSYGQNVYFELAPTTDDYLGSPQTWRRMSAVPLPSVTILHAENSTRADHLMPHFWQRLSDAAEVAKDRHRTRSNYSFVDGHAQAQDLSTTYAPERQVDCWNPSLAH